jgi:hypothetical protein
MINMGLGLRDSNRRSRLTTFKKVKKKGMGMVLQTGITLTEDKKVDNYGTT